MEAHMTPVGRDTLMVLDGGNIERVIDQLNWACWMIQRFPAPRSAHDISLYLRASDDIRLLPQAKSLLRKILHVHGISHGGS